FPYTTLFRSQKILRRAVQLLVIAVRFFRRRRTVGAQTKNQSAQAHQPREFDAPRFRFHLFLFSSKFFKTVLLGSPKHRSWGPYSPDRFPRLLMPAIPLSVAPGNPPACRRRKDCAQSHERRRRPPATPQRLPQHR